MRHVDPLDSDDRPSVVALIQDQQGRPDRHIAYLSEAAAAIAEELEEVAAGPGWVLRSDEVIAGFLQSETDDRLDRVWWMGPFVSDTQWEAGADALYLVARAHLGSRFVQEELAGDDRHLELADFASRHGFTAEEASVALRCDVPPNAADLLPAMTEVDRPGVVALHDSLFPGTHTTGEQLVATSHPDCVRLVAKIDGRVVGYAAAEMQADRSGYLDFIGTGRDHRRMGVGRSLVSSTTRWLFDRGATHAHLTVREGNLAARSLYASLGFVETRVLRPYRKGFRLDG